MHQAGLPLDRCESFAQHVRKVERSLGLPDADDPEAGEQLRETVLESLLPISMPTLKRALRGPAGSHICEVALNVILKGDFKGINPKLGRALERAFEAAQPNTLRRAANQPYLRLGDDLCSLEIVGPRQDASLIGARGLTWIVNGHRYPTPSTEDFVITVTEQPRVVLELTGLTLGNLPSRTFVLRLNDLAEPFILFDERTHRQRRASGEIPPGTYWLLHRAADKLIGAEQTYEWSGDAEALELERASNIIAIAPTLFSRPNEDQTGDGFLAPETMRFVRRLVAWMAGGDGRRLEIALAQSPIFSTEFSGSLALWHEIQPRLADGSLKFWKLPRDFDVSSYPRVLSDTGRSSGAAWFTPAGANTAFLD
ncbi:MAG: hypothetical protein MSG64_20275 [Pyrinomonadaceae bacterium MAG19_C2-C3]|nr:hypothetical protein [Pyrinomonadaceae bacterium MAG19_C2-C3]